MSQVWLFWKNKNAIFQKTFFKKIFEKKNFHLFFCNNIEKIRVKKVKKSFFQIFFPKMFFEKLKKKKCSAEIPHPAQQCACASRCKSVLRLLTGLMGITHYIYGHHVDRLDILGTPG